MARYTKRGKVWQYEISYKSKDGKYKKLRKSAFPKKADAILAASEMEIKLGKGFAINDKDVLLSDYFRQWIKIYKKGKISDVTFLKKEAFQIVANFGGHPQNGINKETNFLVVGDTDYSSNVVNGLTRKQKKATEKQLAGQDIQILSETTFVEQL